MPFEFDPAVTDGLQESDRCIEDRRANPVRGRRTRFRLSQYNMMAYAFPDFVPGFAATGINRLPFPDLIGRPTANARAEGDHLYGAQFALSSSQIAKVEGDIFEEVTAAVLWNAAAHWNQYMVTGEWTLSPRYRHPATGRSLRRQVAVLALPRRYDWVRLLVDTARRTVDGVRHDLAEHDLSLPTSTPDITVVALPADFRGDQRWRTPLPDLTKPSQRLLSGAYREMQGRIEPGEFLLAVAVKKSLRSDRLYQPLYEANIMQLLLEGKLGAPQVDFEVHTLESAGTRAKQIYSAASLGAVATNHARPHRAVRELYEPGNAEEVVRRLLTFLGTRVEQIAP